MDQLPTFLTLPVVVAVAIITGLFSVVLALLGYIFLFPKTRAETKAQLATAKKAGIEIGKIEAETEAAELANQEKRNLLTNGQITALLRTATDQTTQIDGLLKETSAQKVEIDRLLTIVGFNENEKRELKAVITYQQTEIERLQKNWAQTILLVNESRERENNLTEKLENSLRYSRKLEVILQDQKITEIPIPTGALPRVAEFGANIEMPSEERTHQNGEDIHKTNVE